MPDRSEVMAALKRVTDPVLHKAVTDLSMVKSIEVDGADVRVGIVLPLADHPMASALEVDITREVERIPGVQSVDVRFEPMDDGARAELRQRLQRTPEGKSPIQDPQSRTRVIAVASGKGGVGKSSVTVNLAIQLARMDRRVAVIDADVWGFSVPRMLGVERPPDLLDEMIVPPVAHGVSVISIGFFVKEDQPVIWRGPMLHKALEQFLTDVYWGDPDYLLVDMPPGTGDVSLSMAQFLPRAELIVVTTPQPAAQRVAQRAAAMARKVNLAVFGVIENMSWFTGNDGTRYEIFGAGGGQALADDLRVPLLGQVPLEPALREGGDVGRPISVVNPDAAASRAFASIAEKVEKLGPRRRRIPLAVRSAEE